MLPKARSGEGRIEAVGLRRLVSHLLRGIIRGYQIFFSPLLGPRCRHLPTCSDYALEAVAHHGPWRGAWLALCRIGRCHPLGTSGFDPVPGTTGNAPRES